MESLLAIYLLYIYYLTRHIWFLIAFVQEISICVWVCVPTPEAIKNWWHDVVWYEPHTFG